MRKFIGYLTGLLLLQYQVIALAVPEVLTNGMGIPPTSRITVQIAVVTCTWSGTMPVSSIAVLSTTRCSMPPALC